METCTRGNRNVAFERRGFTNLMKVPPMYSISIVGANCVSFNTLRQPLTYRDGTMYHFDLFTFDVLCTYCTCVEIGPSTGATAVINRFRSTIGTEF